MANLKHQNTKTLTIRPNGRSADFITPNFIYGCAGGCRSSYCYVMRYNPETIYINDNVDQILNTIEHHAKSLVFPKPPNQTDPVYWTYDIGCSTDVVLHWKHYDWVKVFEFFKLHPKIKATFATKYVNYKLLDFKPDGKIRIRFSLMPQTISSILEPKTSLILDRIHAIKEFAAAGYEVHLNFSPIVMYSGWINDYDALFALLEEYIPDSYKANIQAECIFLTHNIWQHERNLEAGREASEAIIWQPKYQEVKQSQYGSEALRYKLPLKAKAIKAWQACHDAIIPWNKIRYIF